MMKKISIISVNLSTNCTGRCLVLARALREKYDVEIIGTTFGVGSAFGEGLWPPIKNTSIPIRAVRGSYWPGYAKSIRNLLNLMNGDLIIACKPRLSSFGVALLKRQFSGTPVILDVDDDELAQTSPGKNRKLVRRVMCDINGDLTTGLVHKLRGRADAVFCVSEYFRNIYGGVIVPHGREVSEFDPGAYDRDFTRRQIGINSTDTILGFIGTPQAVKGIDITLEAICKLNNPRVKLMIVGVEPGSLYGDELRNTYGNKVILIPWQPIEKAPFYLSASDIVVLPSRNERVSFGQMPAKLTDAMAMAKPIIASRISDMPRYLDGCGLLVEPDNVDDLVTKIQWVIDHMDQALEMGRRARGVFTSRLSLGAMLRSMNPVIDSLLNN